MLTPGKRPLTAGVQVSGGLLDLARILLRSPAGPQIVWVHSRY